MRDALRGLTGRGRGLVAAGLAVALGSWAFGQRDLLRVAVLLLALPLLSAALVARTRYRLASSRTLSSSRVPVGGTVTVTVVLQNVSRLPSGLLLVADEVPPQLGVGPRVVLDRVEPQGRREITYEVQGSARGRYALGPLSVRLVDPFGLVSLTRSFRTTDLLLVTPQVHRLPAVPLGGDWAGAGESRSRAVSSSGEDDVVPRDYRTGDELRRVHWKATARYGDLMVRREEQPWRSRATVVVDTRSGAHRGAAAASSLEWALSAAASVSVHLLHRGWSIRLLDGDGVPLVAETDAGVDTEGLVLDALAVLEASPARTLGVAEPGVRRLVGDGLVVVVLGAATTEEAAGVARIRPGAGTGLALVQDVGAWSTRPAGSGSARTRDQRTADADAAAASAALLTQAGWRTVIAEPDEPLPAAWPLLARGVGVGGRRLRPGSAGRTPTGVGS